MLCLRSEKAETLRHPSTLASATSGPYPFGGWGILGERRHCRTYINTTTFFLISLPVVHSLFHGLRLRLRLRQRRMSGQRGDFCIEILKGWD
jgi:hypothetical protein